jgi:hypothetical protein
MQLSQKAKKFLVLGLKSSLGLGHLLTKHSFIASLFICSIIFIISIKILLFQLNIITISTSSNSLNEFYLKHDFMLNNLFGIISLFRRPVLFFIGIIAPLILFVSKWHTQLILDIMNPYFLLIGAQAGTIFIASTILGPGADTFVGLFFSLFRSAQVLALRSNLNISYTPIKAANSEMKLKHHLRLGLLFVLGLWALNALYLTIFVGLVTWGLLALGLTYNWPF